MPTAQLCSSFPVLVPRPHTGGEHLMPKSHGFGKANKRADAREPLLLKLVIMFKATTNPRTPTPRQAKASSAPSHPGPCQLDHFL